MWLGLPVLGLAMLYLKVPFFIPRERYRELFWLAATNMFVWHAVMIVVVKNLSSGRSAILGYTMPVFSALFGAWFFGQQLRARNWLGVAAAALGVSFLLWHELTQLSGRPLSVLLALVAAATWAVGTQRLRTTTMPVATLTISLSTAPPASLAAGADLGYQAPLPPELVKPQEEELPIAGQREGRPRSSRKPRPFSTSSSTRDLSLGPRVGSGKSCGFSTAMSASRATSARVAASTSATSAALSGICQSLRLAISGPYQAAAPVCSGGSSNDMIDSPCQASHGNRGANSSVSLVDRR
jgi:hypothetical protein